jgi:hypothetical protein
MRLRAAKSPTSPAFPPRTSSPPPRLLIGLNLVGAAGLLLAPSVLLGDHAVGGVDRRARVLARILGARQLGEALILMRRATPGRMLAGASANALHAASMILLARFSPRWRGPALTSAAMASALCVCAVRASANAARR